MCEYVGDRQEPPFELALARNTASGQVGSGWPHIQSETAFLVSLVQQDAARWDVSCLEASAEQMHTFHVVSRKVMDKDTLREKEKERLERQHALRLLKKMQKTAAGGDVAAPKRRRRTAGSYERFQSFGVPTASGEERARSRARGTGCSHRGSSRWPCRWQR